MATIPPIVRLAVALGFGTLTSTLIYLHLRSLAQTPTAVTKSLVIARTALRAHQVLEASDLATISVNARLAGTFEQPSALLGRIVLVDVPRGEALQTSHLASRSSQPDLWHQIPVGQRATTIAINEIAGVAGFLAPGRRVDVIAVSSDGQTWRSATIAQNVPILAIAQDDRHAADSTEARVVNSATLLVNPSQAEAISLALEKGHIRLSLRAPNDHTVRRLPTAERNHPKKPGHEPDRSVQPAQSLRTASQARIPATSDSGIEVIRGNQSEVIKP